MSYSKAIKILRGLKSTDKLYRKKASLLALLISDPDGGHIIDGDLVRWADKAGIKTELNCEDHTSWWTCRI